MNNLNNSVDEVVECPLCMEPLEVDDLNFFPCTCGYQICRFCWHRIRTDENELCPACRKEYPENPADFKPLTQEEMIAFKSQKRQRDQQRKQKITENRKHLANVRVVQKNLVFVVGLPPRLADADILKKHEYFGKYGKIHKVVINPSTAYAGVQGPSASAYVTYVHNTDALRAIQSVNNIMIDGRLIKTSLGTTKYCSHFMKNQQCPKGDCMYLHELGDPEASFTKEEMHQGKHQEYEKRLHDILIASSTGCAVTTGGSSTLNNISKNSESSKITGNNSSVAPTTSPSVSLCITTNNLSSTAIGCTPQKEAWPCLSTSPVNQKDTSSTNANKNRKERTKQDKNKSDKNCKTKNNKNTNNNITLNPLQKENDLPVIIEGSLTNSNSLNEESLKHKVDKNKERNQHNLVNRSNSKKELGSSTIFENETNGFGNHSKAATSTSHNLENSGGYLSSKIRNDNNISKVDSHRSLSSSSNSSSSCVINTSDNNSLINESISGKSSPGSFNENNANDEHTKSPIKCKRPSSPDSTVDIKTESKNEKNNSSENYAKSYGYVDNLFGKSESIGIKAIKDNINNVNNNNVETKLYLNESTESTRYEKINYNENEGADSVTDTMSKLNLFDENSFFSSNTGILHAPMNIKQNEEIVPQLTAGTAPNLPDLINGIDAYQNTTNEWEEALKNVMLKTNKQLEEKIQQNLQQQQIQNQSHLKHQEELQRLQEIQKRNNILSSLNTSQLSGAQTDFQNSSNGYLSGSDLSRQTSYLQYPQQPSDSSNDNITQNSLFGTNMSKFFDFHKHQQQKLQHCLQNSSPNSISGTINENLHMMPLMESSRLNSQLLDSSCILTSQQHHQKQKLFGKIDQMICHQTLPQVSNQQINSVQNQQNQYVHSSSCDDDLGFDPFIETQKALAELIENEEEQNAGTSSKLMNHKQLNNVHQPHQQQHMMEYMQRARMPPPGFNHVNNFSGYGVVPRIQNSKVMSFMNLSNNYVAPTGQHIQHQQQVQVPSNAWGSHLGSYQQHVNEQQIRQVNSNQLSSGHQKGYTGNDWTAMDPAILSFRQFSFPHQSQVSPQIQPQQQEMFLQQLAQQQQQTGFSSQSQHLTGGNVGMPNTIMNSQQSSQTHVNANVQGMLEYLKTRQFV